MMTEYFYRVIQERELLSFEQSEYIRYQFFLNKSISFHNNYIHQCLKFVSLFIIAKFRSSHTKCAAMEFLHGGKIPATSSTGTADRVIIDRAMKNYTKRTSRLVSSRVAPSRRIASRRDSREFTRNDRVINNLRTHLPRITSSISVPPSEVENIFFPSLGASLPPSRDMSNRKVQEVCHDCFQPLRFQPSFDTPAIP